MSLSDIMIDSSDQKRVAQMMFSGTLIGLNLAFLIDFVSWIFYLWWYPTDFMYFLYQLALLITQILLPGFVYFYIMLADLGYVSNAMREEGFSMWQRKHHATMFIFFVVYHALIGLTFKGMWFRYRYDVYSETYEMWMGTWAVELTAYVLICCLVVWLYKLDSLELSCVSQDSFSDSPQRRLRDGFRPSVREQM